eukprot:TRINITY_DN17705_c0_g1_i1.p1 TRINITY_DN17705_c0_g1~~TRINITY_DN17705_c0_g1_i1.p1  ORF type:complete len:488 (-),score=77.75 TRINITY_DN17705_c0_g1_i1:232-1695(-)
MTALARHNFELGAAVERYKWYPRGRSSLPDRFYWDPQHASSPLPTSSPPTAPKVEVADSALAVPADTAQASPTVRSVPQCVPPSHAEAHQALLDYCVELGSVSLETPQAATTEAEIASWAKSLFLKDKKSKQLFMVTSPSGADVSLKSLAAALGVKELRMAGTDDMRTAFGLERGCVTAMSVLTDVKHVVTSVLHSRLREVTRLRMCTGCADALDHSQHHISEQSFASLVSFLDGCGHTPLIFQPESGTVAKLQAPCESVGGSDTPSPTATTVTAAVAEIVAVSRKTDSVDSPASREDILARMKSEKSRTPDPVERCDHLCQLCNLEVKKISHEPVVASDGQTSNEHHHVVLSGRATGHIVVSLFLKGKKKKTLCLIVRKPSTKPDLKALGSKLAAWGLPDKEFRLADEESMVASLGVGRDFASPLALVDDLVGSVALVVFDTALEDGQQLLCLPPGQNSASWGMSMDDCEKYAVGCGAKTARMSLT